MRNKSLITKNLDVIFVGNMLFLRGFIFYPVFYFNVIQSIKMLFIVCYQNHVVCNCGSANEKIHVVN